MKKHIILVLMGALTIFSLQAAESEQEMRGVLVKVAMDLSGQLKRGDVLNVTGLYPSDSAEKFVKHINVAANAQPGVLPIEAARVGYKDRDLITQPKDFKVRDLAKEAPLWVIFKKASD